jgi:hypothetical protein
MLQNIVTWFIPEWTSLVTFFSMYPLALVVMIVSIIGAIVVGLREPKTAMEEHNEHS